MEFPFDIFQVADLLGLEARRYHAKSADYDCPFCDGKGKLNLNVELNAYRCNKCGNQGGMIDLFCKSTGLADRKQAYRMLSERTAYGTTTREARKKVVSCVKESPKADLKTIDRCYNALLDCLELQPQHRDNLLKRGLSEKEIEANRYKSVPTAHTDRLVSLLLEREIDLAGVPGFYKDENGKYKVSIFPLMAGYFVPVYNENRQIQAMQIRLDTPLEGKRKYMWLSSAEKNGGCSSNSPVDISGNLDCKALYVTEGALKGQIAHALSGKTFASIAGVSQMKELEKLLIRLKRAGKCEIIVDALDMDDNENFHVKEAHEYLVKMASSYGFSAKRITWDRKYKGIDDFLLSCRKKKGEDKK